MGAMSRTRSRDEQLFTTLPKARRKALGQFATPDNIATLMAAWIGDEAGAIYDPAVGTGALLRAAAILAGGKTRGRLVGGELDEAAAEISRRELDGLSDAGYEVRVGDWFDTPVEEWRSITCNPPYLNAKNIDRRDELREIVARDSGVSFRGAPNLALLFSARLLAYLAPEGRMALLVPSELLDQSTARPWKEALIKRGYLAGILVFDEADSVFEGAETTATVLLIERPKVEGMGPELIGFLHVYGSDIESAVAAISEESFAEAISAEDLLTHAEGRWTAIFRGEHNEVPGAEDVRLGEIATIISPRVSGWDKFFIRSASAWAAVGIPKAWLTPVLAWKRLIPESMVIDAAWIKACDGADEPIWLLTAPEDYAGSPGAAALTTLISDAEQSDDFPNAMGGKRAWWVVKANTAAPVLVTSYWQSGGHFAVVRNKTEVRGFSTVFEVRPHDAADADRFVASDAVKDAFLRSRRRLGAGPDGRIDRHRRRRGIPKAAVPKAGPDVDRGDHAVRQDGGGCRPAAATAAERDSQMQS